MTPSEAKRIGLAGLKDSERFYTEGTLMDMINTHSRIEIIQIMRLVAALGITVFHCQVIGNHGFCGVEIFNIISGFIAVYSTEDKKRCSWFMLKRIIRIVPLYWLFTIMFYEIIVIMPSASIMSEAKPEFLLKSMFFIPFVNGKGYNTPVLSAGWTLNYEMFFYLVFFIALHISHKCRALICGGILVSLVIIGCVFQKPFVIQYYSNTILLEFIMGMSAYYILRKILEIHTRKASTGILAGVAAIIVALMIFNEDACLVVPRCFRLGLPAFALFIVMVYMYKERRFPGLLVALGNATYSIYLVEFFSSGAYKIVAADKGAAMRTVLLMFCIIATVVSAYYCYRIIEIRFSGWIRKRLIGE